MASMISEILSISSPHFLADTSSVFAVRHYFLAHIWIGVNWRRLSAPLTGWRPPNLSWSIKLISLFGESPMLTLVTLARTMWVIVESGSLGDKATVSLNGNTRRRTWASTWKRILKPSRKQVAAPRQPWRLLSRRWRRWSQGQNSQDVIDDGFF